jgi:hypothetical protein
MPLGDDARVDDAEPAFEAGFRKTRAPRTAFAQRVRSLR